MKTSLKILVGFITLLTLAEAHAMRWYSPNTGRWFSRDPIDERGGKNLFVFVSNDPIDQLDLYGLAGTQIGTKYVANESLPVGHAAIEIDGTSYGFGPKDKDGNPFSTPGTTSGWESVPTPRFKWPLSINTFRRFHDKTGGSCCGATTARIKQCAEHFKKTWEGTTYSVPFRTCRTFVDTIVYSCCLNEGLKESEN